MHVKFLVLIQKNKENEVTTNFLVEMEYFMPEIKLNLIGLKHFCNAVGVVHGKNTGRHAQAL